MIFTLATTFHFSLLLSFASVFTSSQKKELRTFPRFLPPLIQNHLRPATHILPIFCPLLHKTLQLSCLRSVLLRNGLLCRRSFRFASTQLTRRFQKERQVLLLDVFMGRHFLLTDQLVQGRVVVGEEPRGDSGVGRLKGEDGQNADKAENEKDAEGRGSSLIIDSDHLVIQIRIQQVFLRSQVQRQFRTFLRITIRFTAHAFRLCVFMSEGFFTVLADATMLLEEHLVKAYFPFQFLNIRTVPFSGLLGSYPVPQPLFCSVLDLGYFFAFGEIMKVVFLSCKVGFVVFLLLKVVLSSPGLFFDLCYSPIEVLFAFLLLSPELHHYLMIFNSKQRSEEQHQYIL